MNTVKAILFVVAITTVTGAMLYLTAGPKISKVTMNEMGEKQ